MAVRSRNWGRALVPALIALIIGGASLFVGLALTGGGRGAAPQSAAVKDSYNITASDSAAMRSSVAPDMATEEALSGGAADAASSYMPTPEPMVIRNASMELRVKSVESSVEAIRAAVTRHGAEITDLSVYTGDQGPRPLADAASSPSNASITIRVPAAKLDALKRDVAKSGTVLTQSSSSSDVTQQYVDMDARLRNLKAEEARLRGFFDRANKVSDLLDVERELSRVRGEIESMQAQVDYLKRQVARATLTVSLSEPGPVVRPDSGDWGFVDAITQGIQGAAKVVTTLITGLIALLPLLLFVGILWYIVALVRRRRSRRLEPVASPAARDVEEGSQE